MHKLLQALGNPKHYRIIVKISRISFWKTSHCEFGIGNTKYRWYMQYVLETSFRNICIVPINTKLDNWKYSSLELAVVLLIVSTDAAKLFQR